MAYKHTCIAIDDEANALKSLINYIQLHPNLKLVKSFTDSSETLDYINPQEVVDVIFTDIEMPKISRLELASIVKHKVKKIVFTTGHTKYRYDAFELEPQVFLLKPYGFTKFTQIINKLFLEPTAIETIVKPLDDSFYVKEKTKLIKLYFDEVIAFESKLHYIIIYTLKFKVTTYWNLTEVQKTLMNRFEFIQVHRSFIISEKHIESIEGNNIRLSNSLCITVGRKYKADFEKMIGTKVIQ